VVSSLDVSLLLDLAEERNPAAIVLGINSVGGLTSEMNLIIERLIEAQSEPKNQRIVAWVDLGGSAAALTALACKEIIMLPTGRVGSATSTIDGEQAPEPTTAVDQKMRAMEDARRRQVVSLTGRSIALHEAMEFPEKKLWAHETKGFSLAEPNGAGWVALDKDVKRPLAMAAKELLDYGVAEGIAGDTTTLLKTMNLPEDTPVVTLDLMDPKLQKLIAPAKAAAAEDFLEFERVGEAYRKKLEKLWDNLVLAGRAANTVARAENGFNKAELQSLKDALSRCRPPMLNAETKEQLQKSAPDRLKRYQQCLELARTKISRASQSTRQNSQSVPIDAIQVDISMAMDWVYQAIYGVPPPKKE